MEARRILFPVLITLVCFFYSVMLKGKRVEFSQAQYGRASNLEFQLMSNSTDSVAEDIDNQPHKSRKDWNNKATGQDEDKSSKQGTTDDQMGEETSSSSMELLPSTSMQSTRVNCQHLFAGILEYPEEVEVAKHINKSISLQPNELMDETKNCEQYRNSRGYIMHSMTAEEEDFPMAYSILMFTAPGQAERLLRAIYRPQNFYCIHVDLKADNSTKEAMKSISDCFANVFVVPNPADVYWGKFGVLEAEIICMKHLVTFKWKYFINLTGQEFPLASNYKIVKVLKTYNGANEIANEAITDKLKDRWEFIHLPGWRRHSRTTQRWTEQVPSNITIYKGSAHVVLSRNFVDYILSDPVPQQFLNWTRKAKCPEEIFFPSLQYNTHLKAPGTFTEHNNELREPISRHKIWRTERSTKKCYSRNYHHLLCIYGIDDLPSLFKDDHSFFINKLHDDFQPVTHDCLEELLSNKTKEEYSGRREVDLDFFQQLPFVKNHYR